MQIQQRAFAGYQGMRSRLLIVEVAGLALVSSLAHANLVLRPTCTEFALEMFAGDGPVESDLLNDGIIGTIPTVALETNDPSSVFDIRTCDSDGTVTHSVWDDPSFNPTDNDTVVEAIGVEIPNGTHVRFSAQTRWTWAASSRDSSDDTAIGGANLMSGESTDTMFARIAFAVPPPGQEVHLDASVAGSMQQVYTGAATEDAIPRVTAIGLMGLACCALFLGIAACAVMRARVT